MTYSELLTKIKNYTEVTSSVLSDSIIDGFILDTEMKISKEVDSNSDRKQATSNFVASNRYILLPEDLMIVRSVQHITSGGTRTFLEERDLSFISEYNSTDTTGTPKYWGHWHRTNNQQYILVAPIPSAADTCQINYIRVPEHFYSSVDAATIPAKNTTTYLSQKAPDLLFYGTMCEAYGFLKGPMDMYKLYMSKYNEERQAFALEQMGRRRRGEYTDGVPRIPVPSPSPDEWRNLK